MKRYMKDIPFNMIHLCIDEFKDYRMKGRAYNNTIKSCIVFKDINEMFLRFEDIFNHNGNPQAWHTQRTFDHEIPSFQYQYKPETYEDYEKFLLCQGKLETMDIVVKSRKMNEWQGILYMDSCQYEYTSVAQLTKFIINILESKLCD